MPGRPSEIARSSLAVSPESEPNPRCNPNHWATSSTFYLHITLANVKLLTGKDVR